MFRLLEEAWQIIKKYKFLWIFGIFTSYLLLTDPLRFFSILNTKDLSESFLSIKSILALSIGKLNLYNLANISSEILINQPRLYSVIYPLIAVLIFIILALILISIISEISLILAVNRIRKNEDINFKLALRSSFKYFWRIFLFDLFIMFCFLIATIPVLFFILNNKIGELLIYLIITFPLYFAFFFYIAIFYMLGIRMIIIDDMSLVNGILTTDKIIRSNLKQGFKFFIIYLMLDIGLSFLLGLVLAVLLIPAIGFTLITSLENQQPILFAVIKLFAPLIMLISLLLAIIAKGAGSAFISSWITLVYLDYFRSEGEKVEKLNSQEVPA